MTIVYIAIGLVALLFAFKVIGTLIAKMVFESPSETAKRMRDENVEYANPDKAQKIVLNILV